MAGSIKWGDNPLPLGSRLLTVLPFMHPPACHVHEGLEVWTKKKYDKRRGGRRGQTMWLGGVKKCGGGAWRSRLTLGWRGRRTEVESGEGEGEEEEEEEGVVVREMVNERRDLNRACWGSEGTRDSAANRPTVIITRVYSVRVIILWRLEVDHLKE